MSQQVVFLHGPAAAGKHTVGTRVAERLGLPLWHNHLTVDLVKTLFEFGTDEFIALRESIWQTTFAAAAKAGRSFVFTFNPEATVRRTLIDELQAAVQRAGGQVLYVELICSDAEVQARIANPSRAQFGKLTDAALYRQLKAQGSFAFAPLPPAIVSVDTEQLQPDEAADVIVAAIENV
ncbi:MAG: AAA family ATPase [Pseudomonadota bacterium]